MKAMVVYVVCIVVAVLFKMMFRFCCRKFGLLACQEPQWVCFLWASAFLLCGICLMPPYDARTVVDWSPMFLVAFFHIQQCLQAETLKRSNGKHNSGGTTP